MVAANSLQYVFLCYPYTLHITHNVMHTIHNIKELLTLLHMTVYLTKNKVFL